MATRSSVATLSPHVYAVADQAWRMIVSEKKDILRCQCGRALEGHRAAAPSSSTTQLGGVLAPPVHTLGPTTPSTSSTNGSGAPRQPTPALFTLSLHLRLVHSLSYCLTTCASICMRLHTRSTSDLRTLCHTGAASGRRPRVDRAISLGLRRMVRRAHCPT